MALKELNRLVMAGKLLFSEDTDTYLVRRLFSRQNDNAIVRTMFFRFLLVMEKDGDKMEIHFKTGEFEFDEAF